MARRIRRTDKVAACWRQVSTMRLYGVLQAGRRRILRDLQASENDKCCTCEPDVAYLL